MTDDDMVEKVAQLLSEPRPRRLGGRPNRQFSASPLGRAQAMLCLAQDLVAEAAYGAAATDWEERHARLRGLQDELRASMVGARRETLRAEVENLRMRGWARWKQTERLHLELAAASRRAAAIVLCCKDRQAAMTAAGLGRADLIANQMATRDRVDGETRRVLDLDGGTARISVAELYAASAQQN